MDATQRIHDAAGRGALDEVQALVGADPNLVHARDDETPWPTPLHRAAASGHVEVVSWLLDHGADARWQGPQTPLHVAWQRAGNEDVIRTLVARGGAHSALFGAVYLDDIDQVGALLDTDPAAIHERDDVGMTALHRAAENGQAEMVEALLARGADAEARTDIGQTALQRSWYRPDVVAVLLAHGARMDILTAINLGKVEQVDVLLDADPALANLEAGEQVPLQVAARKGDPALVRALLDHGADANVEVGWKAWTPLHWAAQGGNVEAVRLLLAYGAAREVRDEDGNTALDIAAAAGRDQVVALLESG